MKKWTLCAALLCAWLGNSAAIAAGDAEAAKYAEGFESVYPRCVDEL